MLAGNESWESGRINIVTLAEDDPTIFAIFMTWAVHGYLKTGDEYIRVSSTTNMDKVSTKQRYTQLLQCYVLGDSILAETFCNVIINQLIMHNRIISRKFGLVAGGNGDDISFVYSSTDTGSPLRRLLVDNFGSTVTDKFQMADINTPGIPEFYFDLARRLVAVRCGKPLLETWRNDCCAYHIHRGKPKGYSCTKE